MFVTTIGSHSSLQILRGAKEEKFNTAIITDAKRESFYKRFDFIDKYLVYNNFDDAVNNINSINDSIFIPHGSLIEYLGMDRVNKIRVPIFGNRNLFEWESDQKKKMSLLEKSNIKIPESFESIEDVDRLVIVKLPGAKGGKGYFLAKNKSELKNGINRLLEKNIIKNLDEIIIQEYVIGVQMYFQFFYSPILKRVELTGIDIRYESNIDGLKRLPWDSEMEPTFVVTGNIPVVARESILPKAYEYADNFVETTRNIVPPGIIGPFSLESVVTDNLDIVVFEFSGRIVAGTNLYIGGSPYSWLYWNEPMCTGKRIARELNMAIQQSKLDVVTT